MKKYVFFLIIFLSNYLHGQDNIPDQGYCDWDRKTDYFFTIPYIPDPPHIEAGWVKNETFSDEFNDTLLDTHKWIKVNKFCHAGSVLAWYSEDNVQLINNKLILNFLLNPDTCTYDTITNFYKYSVGAIRSISNIRYGFLEIACKLPGVEPLLKAAFWLQWGQNNYDEIDVFEFEDKDTLQRTIKQALHHNLNQPTSQSQYLRKTTFDTTYSEKEFVFGVEWLPTEINFYIDGKITTCIRYTANRAWVSPKSDFSCANFDYARDQNIKISLALRPDNEGEPKHFEDTYDIDYIRVYDLIKGYPQYWPESFDAQDPDLFKVHNYIKLGGNGKSAEIPMGSRFTVWARDSIVLFNGFSSVDRAEFTARTIIGADSLFTE